MPTLLDPPAPVAGNSTHLTQAAAERLRSRMAAVRLAFVWFGVRKTLTQEQKSQAADTFGAEGEYLSAAKKLLDTSHPAYRAVTGVKSRIVAYWRGISLPYPEPGIRLIRQDDVASFSVQLTTLQAELVEAVEQLSSQYQELKAAARQRLGRLFNGADYPATLVGLFEASYDFPSFEPPDYLRQLSPQLYAQEAQRVAARFEEAVQLAEQAFTEELSKVVSHLTDRLSGSEDGKPKVFRDSAVENLQEFFQRFRHLNVRSSQQLDDLVDQAQRIVLGVQPQQLRDNTDLRQQIAAQLSGVQSVLDGLLVDRPRRNILRRQRQDG
ncbi:MAG TPA: hypothetical protein VFV87_18820 [Pirellulaceae bacterium]|nr:hypothetical protein [Pirellulaceae bacterium]